MKGKIFRNEVGQSEDSHALLFWEGDWICMQCKEQQRHAVPVLVCPLSAAAEIPALNIHLDSLKAVHTGEMLLLL